MTAALGVGPKAWDFGIKVGGVGFRVSLGL